MSDCLKDFEELNGNLDLMSEPKCYVGGTIKLTSSGAQVMPVSPTHDGPCTWQEGQVGCCHGYRGCDPNLALLESQLAGMKIEMQHIKDGPATPMVKAEMLSRGDKVVAELEKNIAAMKSQEIKPTTVLGAECDKPAGGFWFIDDFGPSDKLEAGYKTFRQLTAEEKAAIPAVDFAAELDIDPKPQKLITSKVESTMITGFRPFGAGVSARILTPAQLNDCCDFDGFSLPELVKLRDKLNELIYDKERQ